METVADCLQWAEYTLAQSNEALAESCKVDSQWLLCDVLAKNATWLRAWPDHVLEPEQIQEFQSRIQRRAAGEPVAYITARQGFWTLDLSVNEHTLVPRPDTELLVELALTLFDDSPISMVDLGTGTGAIALALKSERPAWNVLATDFSDPALQVAKENADRFKLDVTLLQSCWFDALSGQQFDLIVSNPPYIEAEDEHLQGLGVAFEPITALASGADGLQDIRKIISAAPAYLRQGGWLMLEHGYNQGLAVRELLQKAGFQNVRTERDLGDNDRVSLGQWLEGERSC